MTIVEDHRNMDAISEEDLVNETEDTLTILSKYIKTIESNVDNEGLTNSCVRYIMKLFKWKQNDSFQKGSLEELPFNW